MDILEVAVLSGVHDYYVSFAGLIILLQSDVALPVSDNFTPFLLEDSKGWDCRCICHAADELEIFEGITLASDYDSNVIENEEKGIVRQYHLPGDADITEICRWVIPGKESLITYVGDHDFSQHNLNDFFHKSGWEQMLIYHGRLLLHASCIDTEYGGILFSGPSGIGKSTQADLWIQSEDARLINGDRPILYKEDGWRAYGSPFAGSSGCHLNENVPVTAIVMLDQGRENVIRRLSVREAFRKLYAGMTVYTWDTEYVNRTLDMVNVLSQEIPVYHLTCTPDERAVEILKERLRKDGVISDS